jgi:hypothetical protein
MLLKDTGRVRSAIFSAMEAFKVVLFEQAHAGSFPSYRSLAPAEGQALKARVASRFGLPVLAASSATEFAAALTARQTYYPEANAQEEFALLPLFTALAITPQPELFINWANWATFEELDAFQTTDVAQYFSDLWYPGADDIDLFDASVDWVISIRHDGVVSFSTRY